MELRKVYDELYGMIEDLKKEGLGGSNVSVTPLVTSGQSIAKITVDNVDKFIKAPYPGNSAVVVSEMFTPTDNAYTKTITDYIEPDVGSIKLITYAAIVLCQTGTPTITFSENVSVLKAGAIETTESGCGGYFALFRKTGTGAVTISVEDENATDWDSDLNGLSIIYLAGNKLYDENTALHISAAAHANYLAPASSQITDDVLIAASLSWVNRYTTACELSNMTANADVYTASVGEFRTAVSDHSYNPYTKANTGVAYTDDASTFVAMVGFTGN